MIIRRLHARVPRLRMGGARSAPVDQVVARRRNVVEAVRSWRLIRWARAADVACLSAGDVL